MVNIFYILLFLSNIVDIAYLFSINKIFNFEKVGFLHKKLTGEDLPSKDYVRYGITNPNIIKSSYGNLTFMLILLLIGLLSHNWILFSVDIFLILLFSNAIKLIRSIDNGKYVYGRIHYTIFVINTFSRALITFFIVINYFHLKINIYDYFNAW